MYSSLVLKDDNLIVIRYFYDQTSNFLYIVRLVRGKVKQGYSQFFLTQWNQSFWNLICMHTKLAIKKNFKFSSNFFRVSSCFTFRDFLKYLLWGFFLYFFVFSGSFLFSLTGLFRNFRGYFAILVIFVVISGFLGIFCESRDFSVLFLCTVFSEVIYIY